MPLSLPLCMKNTANMFVWIKTAFRVAKTAPELYVVSSSQHPWQHVNINALYPTPNHIYHTYYMTLQQSHIHYCCLYIINEEKALSFSLIVTHHCWGSIKLNNYSPAWNLFTALILEEKHERDLESKNG